MEKADSVANFQHSSAYYIYFIEFFPKIRLISLKIFKELYEEEGLSALQIAEKFNISKSKTLKILAGHEVSTRRSIKKLRNPKNYRLAETPFGYKKGRDSELVINKTELRVCRLVVQWREQGFTLKGIGLKLEERGFKNRRGAVSWHISVVKKIYLQWKGKV